MGVFTDEQRAALEEAAGSEMKLAYPSSGSKGLKGLETAYAEYQKYVAAIKKAAHKDPKYRKALTLADKAESTLVTALAQWKDAERALYY